VNAKISRNNPYGVIKLKAVLGRKKETAACFL
jgi:hypothetical protein